MIPAELVALALGWLAGIVLHEAAHFAVGYYMGTCTEAGVVVRDHDGLRQFLPVALYVGHTHQNWWSTFAPLAFVVPWGVVELAYAVGLVDGALYAGLWSAPFTACVLWFLSDLLLILGLIDPFNENRKCIPLIEVQPDPAFLSADGGEET